MLDAFLWWLVLSALGLAALPITLTLFRFLPDRGYAFSKPLGLFLVTYLLWILGLADLLPNSRLGAAAAGAVVAVIAAAVLLRRRRSVGEFLRRRWPIVLASELLFVAVFAFWAVVRSYTPAILHTEQPMDFALLNGVLSSASFPPADPWFAGESISYYYLGYSMTAGVTQLTGIASSVTYNLALASTAAMAATGMMSVVFNIVRGMGSGNRSQEPGSGGKGRRGGTGAALMAGVVGVVLFLFMGNLVGFLDLLRVNGAGADGFYDWVAIDGLTAASAPSSWYPDEFWWWFRSSRVINSFVDGAGVDFTITEFPFFSFMLGDLHPHVMSLPFVVMAVGLAHNVLRSRGVPGLHWLRSRPWDVLLFSLVLGSLGFLNSWDMPTFMALFLGALLLRSFHLQARGQRVNVRSLLALMAVIVLGALLLYAPFYANLDTQANGILPVRRSMTRQLHFVIVLGPLLLLSLSLLAALALGTFRGRTGNREPGTGEEAAPDHRGVTEDPRPAPPGPRPRALRRVFRSPVAWAVALPLIPFAFWAFSELGLALADENRLLQAYHSGSVTESLLSIGSRFWHLLPLCIILSLGLAVLFAKARREGGATSSMQLTLLIMMFAFLLTMGAELFHISDFFGNRMNTVFKFYYQAWMLLAVAGAVSFHYWLHRPRAGRAFQRLATASLVGLFAVVIAAGLAFAPPAIYSKTEQFRPDPTLDGLRFVERRDRFEYAAVEWLLENASQGDVIVEASPGMGRPTGDYDPSVSRISQRTGLPTILGWPGHEHQWRGDPFDPISERHRDVGAVYRDGSPEEVEETLARYDVSYVIVGDLERRTYGADVGERFAAMLDIAFENDRVIIYERRHA